VDLGNNAKINVANPACSSDSNSVFASAKKQKVQGAELLPEDRGKPGLTQFQ
jgi:hypothetical protein